MKDRIIELLERGERVELVCTDRDAFIDSDPEFYEMNSSMCRFDYLVVNKASKFDCVMVSSPDMLHSFALMDSDLRYFKIKGPTFNDLIDIAVQAVKDGVIDIKTLCMDSIRFTPRDETDNVATYFGDEYADGFDYIKSLYTETFVIESEENTDKIDVFKCPRFELKNGVRGTIQKCFNNKEFSVQFEDKSWGNIAFMVLKGATVTQKRGNQCNK